MLPRPMVVSLCLLVSENVPVKVMTCIGKSLKVVFIKLVDKQSESKCALVYGQKNEPLGARARVGLTCLTVAEHFCDAEGQDVLLFIDNIFCFTQPNSEVSALLGYEPTLATDLGGLQERILCGLQQQRRVLLHLCKLFMCLLMT